MFAKRLIPSGINPKDVTIVIGAANPSGVLRGTPYAPTRTFAKVLTKKYRNDDVVQLEDEYLSSQQCSGCLGFSEMGEGIINRFGWDVRNLEKEDAEELGFANLNIMIDCLSKEAMSNRVEYEFNVIVEENNQDDGDDGEDIDFDEDDIDDEGDLDSIMTLPLKIPDSNSTSAPLDVTVNENILNDPPTPSTSAPLDVTVNEIIPNDSPSQPPPSSKSNLFPQENISKFLGNRMRSKMDGDNDRVINGEASGRIKKKFPMKPRKESSKKVKKKHKPPKKKPKNQVSKNVVSIPQSDGAGDNSDDEDSGSSSTLQPKLVEYSDDDDEYVDIGTSSAAPKRNLRSIGTRVKKPKLAVPSNSEIGFSDEVSEYTQKSKTVPSGKRKKKSPTKKLTKKPKIGDEEEELDSNGAVPRKTMICDM